LIGICLLLSYNGFCFREWRFLSDRDYFIAAIGEILKIETYPEVLDSSGSTMFLPVNVLPYATVEQFLQQNPNCCRVISHEDGPWPSLGERLWGAAAALVSMTYKLNYSAASGRPETAAGSTIYVITNCGRAWNARH
jgi:hypothetical protein